jgi:NAD(P)-dependent dehydrogenase (short-subunit alcohol dehydrogenase family)
VLVNNAGTPEPGLLTDATDESFDKQFNLNVHAVFQLSREAARRMTRAGWGRIINIGSAFGEAVLMPGVGLYSGHQVRHRRPHARLVARLGRDWRDRQQCPAWAD